MPRFHEERRHVLRETRPCRSSDQAFDFEDNNPRFRWRSSSMRAFSDHNWVVGISVALSCVIAWVQVRHVGLRIAQARTVRLWQLVTKKDISRASNAALTLACSSIYGTLHPDDIRFALTRVEPLRCLAARKWAGNMVQLNGDHSGYEDTRADGWTKIHFGDLQRGFWKGALASAILLSLNSALVWDQGIAVGILSAFNAVGVTVLLCALSVRFDYAARLIDLKQFPKLLEIATAGEGALTQTKSRQPSLRPKKPKKHDKSDGMSE